MTELVRHRSSGEIDLAEVARISKSKLVPEHIANDPASAEYMMRIGASLGLDPTAAFQHIFVFEAKDKKGNMRLKAGMSAHLMHALAVAAGHTLHIEGDALKATAILVRNSTLEDLDRFRVMREEERRQKLSLLEDVDRLYQMQRQQIRDQIEDLRTLIELGGEAGEGEIVGLREQLGSLRTKYDFDDLHKRITETKFDLSKLTRFESVWTKKRADGIEGLTNKGTWQDYGPEMLKSRAKSSVVRDGAIEVILGVRRIMGDLGVQFSDDIDDTIAMSSVLYTPEELQVDVDGDGVPLNGRVVDVTMPGVSKEQDRLVKQAAQMVESASTENLIAWVKNTAERPDVPMEVKASRIDAALKAVKASDKAEAEVPHDGETRTLSAYMEDALTSLH